MSCAQPWSRTRSHSGSVQRTITTTNSAATTTSDLTSVEVTLQADASGNMTVVSASGTRVINVSQKTLCHRPPNFTPDFIIESVAVTNTLSGGAVGGSLAAGVGFQPFLVNTSSIFVRQDPSISNDQLTATFNDCVTVTRTSSIPSNSSPTDIGFSGAPILGAGGSLIGFDFTRPVQIVSRSGTVTTTSFSGRLLR